MRLPRMAEISEGLVKSAIDALVHMVEGEVEIKISGQPYALKTGDAIIMPADQPHALKATKRFKMLLIMIR